MTPSLHLVTTTPSAADQARAARTEAARHARSALLETISHGAEFAERLNDLQTLGADVSPAITDRALRLANHIQTELLGMGAVVERTAPR